MDKIVEGCLVFLLLVPGAIFYAFTDSILLTLLCYVGLILLVTYVVFCIEKIQKTLGKWKFPIDQFQKLCAATGVIDVSSEDDFCSAQKMVMRILEHEKIPKKHYHLYTSRDKIEGYYRTMRADPSWDTSPIMQKIGKCYDACKAEKVETVSTPGQREKARLIIATYFTNANVDIVLNEGRRLRCDEQLREENQKMEAKQEEERTAYKELTRFAKLHGRAKRVAMYESERQICNQELEALKKQLNGVCGYAKTQMKDETNWASAGGIAEGIAGPAAGLATAIDVQNRNAEIRANNQRVVESNAGAILYFQNEIKHKEWELQSHEKRVNRARISLVDEIAPDVLFEKLHFGEPTINVTQTGTIMVEIQASADKFTIYDDRDAVVDGSVIADIYDGDTEIGRAILVFPRDGIGETVCELKGIALFCGKTEGTYRAEIAANDLWAIER